MEYRDYTATIVNTGELVGGAPLSKGLAREYAELLIAGESNILKAIKRAVGEITPEAIERYLEKGTSIFHRSKGLKNGLKVGTPVIVNYQWTALMRDAAKLGNLYGARAGLLGYSIQNGGMLFPSELAVGETEMSDDRPVQPFKNTGGYVRQASIIRYEFVPAGQTLTVPFQVIQNDSLPEEAIRKLWELAQHIGIGSMRHLQGGKFEVTALDAGPAPKASLRKSSSVT